MPLKSSRNLDHPQRPLSVVLLAWDDISAPYPPVSFLLYTGKAVVEGRGMVSLWKIAFRLVFRNLYCDLPIDEARDWFKLYVETVEQNPMHRQRANALVPHLERFVRQSPDILVRTYESAKDSSSTNLLSSPRPEYWLIRCYDGDAVIDVKKRIQQKLNIPVEEQHLSILHPWIDELGEQVLATRNMFDMDQVTLDLVPESGIVDLSSTSSPHLTVMHYTMNRIGSEDWSSGGISPSMRRASSWQVFVRFVKRGFATIRRWQRRVRKKIMKALSGTVMVLSRWLSLSSWGREAAQAAADKAGLSPASHASPLPGLLPAQAALSWLSADELADA
eukprot:CAMPEP_0181335868 /NCGR_PEP_ID=MMETSP1101-20121128/27084_1 /TAXON_ID=46948 /ORGANISM="Rhodomonas abbreviata, Strain Caron Lab Isolate" /LENGTH=332 /DNA_ID=CAMNT_0023446063 /DNA_START=149 /DNA_END=1148 /DNA_ORIENTATION=+